MLIYSGGALIYAILLGVIVYLLGLIFPDFHDIMHPFFWLVAALLAVALEWLDAKPRLFFIPIWLVTIIAFGFSIVYAEFWEGIIAIVLLFIVTGSIVAVSIGIINRRMTLARAALSAVGFRKERNYKFKLLQEAFYVPQIFRPSSASTNYLTKIYELIYKWWLGGDKRRDHFLYLMDKIEKLSSEKNYKAKAAHFHSELIQLAKNKESSISLYMIENVEGLVEQESNYDPFQRDKEDYRLNVN